MVSPRPTRCVPDDNPYVDTRIAAEQIVLQAHAANEIEATIVRPGDVNGPGSPPWTLLPLEMIRKNRFVLPAMGRGIFSPVFIDDLVPGLALAAEHPAAAGQVFTMSGGVGITCRNFFGHYYRMLGKGRPVVVPTRVALTLAHGIDTITRLGRPTTKSTRQRSDTSAGQAPTRSTKQAACSDTYLESPSTRECG